MNKVLLSGASGLIGSQLVTELKAGGYQVARLVRSEKQAAKSDCLLWYPEKSQLDSKLVEGYQAIIHLGGVGLFNRRWSNRFKQQLRSSRVNSTALLATAIAASAIKPKVLIVASAIGYYGSNSPLPVDETAGRGQGFLAQLCEDWELATLAAKEAGVRVVNARLGIVLSTAGGALAKMVPVFRCWLGGALGNGEQVMSWISSADAVNALIFCVQQEQLSGPVNLVAPEPVSNRQYTKTLAQQLRRPAVFDVPATVLRILLGTEMANECLLSSIHAQPQKLLEAGFNFTHTNLAQALASSLLPSAEMTK